jgi:hypothetical protein
MISGMTKYAQGDQKVSVHLMITIQKVTSNVQSVSRQSPDIQHNLTAWRPTARARGDTRLTLTLSVIPNSNYVIMVSD